MQKRGVFFDEWRRCLQEHYLYVIRTRDMVTEPTLRQIMLRNDFEEDQLEALKEVGICQDERGQADPYCQELYQQVIGGTYVVREPLPSDVITEASEEETPPIEELVELEEVPPPPPFQLAEELPKSDEAELIIEEDEEVPPESDEDEPPIVAQQLGLF